MVVILTELTKKNIMKVKDRNLVPYLWPDHRSYGAKIVGGNMNQDVISPVPGPHKNFRIIVLM